MTRLVQRIYVIVIVILAFAGMSCLAATHYVVTNNPAAQDPYTNWAMAGTNIIEVVIAAQTNDAPRIVWVTNGTYYPTNQIYVTNDMQIKSMNGYSTRY